MSSTIPSTPRPRSSIAVSLLAATYGCAASVEHVHPEHAIAEAIPAAGLIELRQEGGPIDEDRPAEGALSLAEAIERALHCDPGLQAALARVRVAQLEAEETALPPDPVLDVVLRFGEGGEVFPEIGIAQEFIGLLSRSRRVEAMENRLRAEASRALEVALDVLAETQSRYASAQALEELGGVLRGRLDIAERMRQIAEGRLEAGEGTRADLDAISIEKLAIEIEIAERSTELRRERLALSRLVGEPSGAADWSIGPWRPVAFELTTEAAWVATALERNPAVQEARWELAARDAELAIASKSALEGTSVGLKAEGDGNDWSAGPSLSMPLPWSGRSRVKHERALALQAESRHRLTEAERRAVEDVRAAFATALSSAANLQRLRDELIPIQERRLSDVEPLFLAREIDVTLLLLADQNLQESRARLVELQRQTSFAVYELEHAIGGPAFFDRIAGGRDH